MNIKDIISMGIPAGNFQPDAKVYSFAQVKALLEQLERELRDKMISTDDKAEGVASH